MTTATRRAPRASASSPKNPDHAESFWRSTIAAVTSGLFLVAAFPKLDQGWLAWFALVPLLMSFPHARMRNALAQAFIFAAVYFGGLLAWMVPFAGHQIGYSLGVVSWIIATLAQVLVILVFAVGLQLLGRRRGQWPWLLGVPALWCLFEWVRQLGPLGDGWGDLAYCQHASLLVIQTAKVTGIWGISFLIVMANALIASLPLLKPRHALVPALLLLSSLGYGWYALGHEDLNPTFVAAALQTDISPNSSQWVGERAGTDSVVERIIAQYDAQADEAARHGAKLVVWPETAFPGYLRDDPALAFPIAATAARNREAMLIGTFEHRPGTLKDANSLTVMDQNGVLQGSYAKRQLVPFGEYVPGRQYMPWLERLHLSIYDHYRGEDRQPLLDAGAPAGKVGAAICYESSYSRLTQEQVARGADLLAVVSDDTWFGKTPAAAQHADISALRAAESDRYLIRAAPTGISEIVDPTGRVIAQAGLFTSECVWAPVEARHTMPPFNRYGDWFVGLAGVLALLSLNGCLPSRPGKPRKGKE